MITDFKIDLSALQGTSISPKNRLFLDAVFIEVKIDCNLQTLSKV